MIDYLTLLLINMTAGFVLLAAYVALGLTDPDQRRWVPGFAITGLIALVFGTHMTTTWPLLGPYNIAFGEMSVLFGAVFLGAAVAIAMGWGLLTVATYAFFAGLVALVLGVRFFQLHLTTQPLLSAIGFILSGLGGVLALPVLLWFKSIRLIRYLGALVLLGAAGIWAITGYASYWLHIVGFQEWVPRTMRVVGGG